MSLKVQIEEFLRKNGPSNINDILGSVESTKNTIRQTLMLMTKEGVTRRVDRGIYDAVKKGKKVKTEKPKASPEKGVAEKPEANRSGSEPLDDAFLYLIKTRFLVLAQDEEDAQRQLDEMLSKLTVQDFRIGKVKQAEETEIAVRIR